MGKALQDKIRKFKDQFGFPQKKLKLENINEIKADVERSGVA